MSIKAFLDAAAVNSPLLSPQVLIHCVNAWHIHYHHYFVLLLLGLVLGFLFCFGYGKYIFWEELNY